MATRSASPTAQLLRSSRLFSVPRPLPRPPKDRSEPETATSSYPTHQAITRPYASQDRREWGLKRSMPTKAAGRGWNPAIHIISHDTDESVTEYSSAGAHTRTLEKWQELDLPMRVQGPARTISRERYPSAFDSGIDVTDRVTNSDGQGRIETGQVWKYDNVPIDRMTDGDFDIFLQKVKSANRGAEFVRFLKDRYVQNEVTKRQRTSDKQGSFDEAALREEVESSDGFEGHLREWRSRRQEVNSSMNLAIEEFLGLPPRSDASRLGTTKSFTEQKKKKMSRLIPYTTHPSAGLSYITDNNFIDNDPVQGPRQEHKPVRVRELSVAPYMLGVGGIAVNGIGAGHPSPTVDMYTAGGHKLWVTPQHAAIDSTGRISMTVATPSNPAKDDTQSALAGQGKAHQDIEVQWHSRQLRRAKAHAAASSAIVQKDAESGTAWSGLALLKMDVRAPKSPVGSQKGQQQLA